MQVSYSWSVDSPIGRRVLAAVIVAFVASMLGQLALARPTLAAGYDAAADPNSMYSITQRIGAQAWWQAGFTGSGIDVALIDTGCTPVAGLDAPGKLVNGPDLSLESQAPNLRNLDPNGHGTFMAGLIAANDAVGAGAPDPALYRGVAPDARVLCLKVGTADGGTDVSQVIAAIDWVVQHRTDHGWNIRVLNLSYGTNSTQQALVDPLAYAAEQAWLHGIFVVAAAGNSGYQRGRGAPGLASPAADPFLMAVGATTYDANGNGDNKPRISVAPFSASASGAGDVRNPELLAPCAHLQGLRVGGS
jgi:serine protease AprX